MTFEETCQALEALAPFQLDYSSYGGWRVVQRVEIKSDGVLTNVSGRDKTPELAIEDHWQRLVDKLQSDQWVVVDAYRDTRRDVRWNGFRWYDVPEARRKAS